MGTVKDKKVCDHSAKLAHLAHRTIVQCHNSHTEGGVAATEKGVGLGTGGRCQEGGDRQAERQDELGNVFFSLQNTV